MITPQEVRSAERLKSLRLSGLLDTPPEAAFDRFAELAHQIIGVPVVLVSLVDEDRQFFKSQIGLPEPWASARETPLSHSFCQHVVNTKQPLIVSDARENDLVKDNLAVADIGIIAYAGIPLETSDHQILGSFCAIDSQPRQWSDNEILVLKSLAEMVIREVELRKLAQEYQSRFDTLQKAEMRRDDLVHMIVHDLRTPLSSLSGGLQALDVLLAEDADDSQRQMLDIARRGARSLSQMVDTILDVSRGEAGLLDVNCKPISPLSLINIALEQTQSLSQKKSQSLSVEVAGDLPTLCADESKLSRVLVNLLGNAIQYTPAKGRIHITVERDTDDSQSQLWRVHDNGSGISQGELQTIFEKFGQGTAANRSAPSSGIGLTFCKMVVEAHGGRIWAESEVGQGSRFCFTIPPEHIQNARAQRSTSLEIDTTQN